MVFLSRVSEAKLSLQYVNVIICMVSYGGGISGEGWPMAHGMSGLSLAEQ